jgi:hypothetical protein
MLLLIVIVVSLYLLYFKSDSIDLCYYSITTGDLCETKEQCPSRLNILVPRTRSRVTWRPSWNIYRRRTKELEEKLMRKPAKSEVDELKDRNRELELRLAAGSDGHRIPAFTGQRGHPARAWMVRSERAAEAKKWEERQKILELSTLMEGDLANDWLCDA